LLHARTPQAGRSEDGFTIIEALVALALVTTVLAAIGSLVSSSFRGVRSLEQHNALLATARDIASSLPRNVDLVGPLTGEAFGQRWRVDTRPYLPEGIVPPKDSPWIPFIVRVHVQSPSRTTMDIDTIRLQSVAPR
jgi:general secretion pathway protein I